MGAAECSERAPPNASKRAHRGPRASRSLGFAPHACRPRRARHAAMLLQTIAIFAVSLAGGCVPLVFGVRDHLRRMLLAAATGVLLGALFLHLLPELAHLQSSLSSTPSLWMFVIAVVVGLGLAD